MNRHTILLLTLLAAPMLRAQSPPAAPKPAAPGLDACPAVVREAVLRAAGSDRVEKVRAVRRGEQTLYLADIDRDGDHDLKLQVLATGEVVRRTEELPVDRLPAPVKQALESLAGTDGRIEEIKKISEGAKDHFKVEIDRPDGSELDVTVAPDGTILEQKEDKED